MVAKHIVKEGCKLHLWQKVILFFQKVKYYTDDVMGDYGIRVGFKRIGTTIFIISTEQFKRGEVLIYYTGLAEDA